MFGIKKSTKRNANTQKKENIQKAAYVPKISEIFTKNFVIINAKKKLKEVHSPDANSLTFGGKISPRKAHGRGPKPKKKRKF